MKREEIVSLVNEVFEEYFELEQEELLPEKLLFDDLGLDSLDIVDMIVGLQKKFGINLRNQTGFQQIRSLKDVYDFLENIVMKKKENGG